MMKRSVLLVGVVVLCLVPGLTAQNAGQEIGLQFEISKSGTVIARPSIVVAASGTKATVPLVGGTTFSVTPTRIDADTVRLSLELTVGKEAVEVKASVLPRP